MTQSRRFTGIPTLRVLLQIVVHGLPWSTEWQELKDLAKEHGDVVKADVMRRPDGKSRGFGTIVFKTPEDAQAAIEVSLPICCGSRLAQANMWCGGHRTRLEEVMDVGCKARGA